MMKKIVVESMEDQLVVNETVDIAKKDLWTLLSAILDSTKRVTLQQ
jgi:hypothetical protein